MSLAAVANAAKSGYKAFYRTFADHRASWMDLTDPVVQDAPTLVEADIYGGGLFTAQSGVAAPTPNELNASKSVTNIGRFEHSFHQPIGVAKDHPEIVSQLAAKTAQLALWTLAQSFWDALTTLDVTTHPENGNGVVAAQGGGTVYFCDDFTVTPKSGSGAFNQSNLFTGALDHATLSSALAARAKYLDKDGLPLSNPEDKPWLLTVQDLRRTAKDLYVRKGEIYDGTSLQSGSFTDELAGVKSIPPGITSDANDWWLWWIEQITDENGVIHRRGPVAPWLRSAPEIRFTLAPDGNSFYILGYMEYGIAYSTSEAGVIMNKVT